MVRGYKAQLYPNEAQKILLTKHFGSVRWVYNWALEKCIKSYQQTKMKPSRYDLQALLPVLKKQTETAWLTEVDSHCLQDSLVPLDAAFKNFFSGMAGFPKFKSVRQKQKFTSVMAKLIDGGIQLPKFATTIKHRGLQEFIGKICFCTISKSRFGKYFLSVTVDDGQPLPVKQLVTEAGTVGIDLGLTYFATLSTGERIENPRHLKWSSRKLCRLQRQHVRKKKGSNNQNKARLKVARAHERVHSQRLDFLHKLSTRLIRENQAVAVEHLNVTGMVQNHKLAKAISEVGWAEFIRQLKYKADWNGKTLLQIGRFEPSSKLCTCGIINRELRLSDRQWTCAACGTTHDRDILAANNIKWMALVPLV
jgi:putative transposase